MEKGALVNVVIWNSQYTAAWTFKRRLEDSEYVKGVYTVEINGYAVKFSYNMTLDTFPGGLPADARELTYQAAMKLLTLAE